MNTTIAPSYVQDVLNATPANKDEAIHIGLPKGRVFVNNKWKDTALVTELQKHVRIFFTDIGSVDFYPSETTGVVYVSEVDVTTGTSYRRNLTKLRNAKLRGYVLYEKTEMTMEWFYTVQKFAVLDLGLTFFPVESLARAAQVIVQIERNERRTQINPFLVEKTVIPFDVQLVDTFNSVHGVGPLKTKVLLRHFKSMVEISNASIDELTTLIGKSAAQTVYNLFR